MDENTVLVNAACALSTRLLDIVSVPVVEWRIPSLSTKSSC